MRRALLFAFLAACTGTSSPLPSTTVTVAVAPLTLRGLTNACYGLSVLNEAGETVWSQTAICADTYGDFTSDVLFVGSCDASDPNGDGRADATVVLRVEGLYGPALLDDWRDPCGTSGCRMATACTRDADTRVPFNLTIVREANQGFFDIGVSFDDVFCSAKVDCVEDFAFHPVTHAAIDAVVWGFACTDGDPPGTPTDPSASTHLYMSEVVLDCGGTNVLPLDPSAGPGHLFGDGHVPVGPVAQATVYEGVQLLSNGPFPADKLFWNMAIGFNPAFFVAGAPTCTLKVRATASRGPLTDGVTPANTDYPYIDVSVPLNTGADVACGRHPVNGSGAQGGVSTRYTGMRADGSGFATTAFAFVGARNGAAIDTRPIAALVNECQQVPAPCDANAACTDLAVGFACTCNPGYAGSGTTCSDVDACATSPCFAGVSCSDRAAPSLGFTCGACPAGRVGDGVTCTDLDACGASPCYAGVACTDAPPPSTGFSCGPCPEGTTGSDGIHCTDIDGCVGVTCFPGVACIDNVAPEPGGHCGACPSGYVGDGVSCSDIDECQGIPVCYIDPESFVQWCTNTIGSYVCSCPAGYDGDGVTCVPPSFEPLGVGINMFDGDRLVGATRVALSFTHVTAVRGDGRLYEWGHHHRSHELLAARPAILDDVVDIAEAEGYSLAVTRDGSLLVWGTPSFSRWMFDYRPVGLQVVDVDANNNSAIVALADGTVYAWSAGGVEGVLVAPDLVDAVAVAAGDAYRCALQADGRVVCWGGGGVVDVPLDAQANVVAIAGANASMLALRADGRVVAWGDALPVPVEAQSGVVAIAAGDFGVWLALREDGTVVSVGTQVPNGLGGVVAIAAGSATEGAVVARDGTVTVYPASGDHGESRPPIDVLGVVAMSPGTTVLAMRADLRPFALGDDGMRRLFPPENGQRAALLATAPRDATGYVDADSGRYFSGYGGSQTASFQVDARIVQVVMGDDYTLVLTVLGEVVAGPSVNPVAVIPPMLGEVVAIAAGERHALALRADDTVVAWGEGFSGEAQVPTDLGPVIGIAAGTHHSVALRADGTVACWGECTTFFGTPQPAGLDHVVQVAAGDRFTLALTDDGSVVGWGEAANYLPPADWTVERIEACHRQVIYLRGYDPALAPSAHSSGLGAAPGATVTVDGSGFEHVLAVRIEGRISEWTVVSPTRLQVRVPPGTTAQWGEVVTASGSATF